MAKVDRAAKIVTMAREVHNGEYWYNDRKIEQAIRRAIKTAVLDERERCIDIITKIQLDPTTSTETAKKLNDAFNLIDRPNNRGRKA